MQFNHRNNDLQLFYDRPGPQITPTRKRSPTPIRIGSMRLIPSKENIPKSNSSRNINEFNHPKSQFPSRKMKPMISPSRNPFPEKKFMFPEEQRPNIKNYQTNSNIQTEKQCPNHLNKVAEFMIQIEDDQMLYCQKCAAQLASQGFEVTRVESSTIKKGSCHKTTVRRVQQQLPKYPEYEGSKMYQEILLFLKELNIIEQEHHENMDKFEQIDNHYNKQIKITENFYDQLLKTVQIMKEDHLSDLIEESRRHSQIADIEHDYLRENVDEMDIIRKDIENNLQVIMQKLEEEELYENLNEYRQKIQVFRHKVEEQIDVFDEIINYTEEELEKKQILVQDYMLDVWSEKQHKKTSNKKQNYQQQQYKPPKSKENFNYNPPHSQGMPPKSSKPMINMQGPIQGQGIQGQSQGQLQGQLQGQVQGQMPGQLSKKMQMNSNNPPAFRKLFDDEENGLVSETSPQFKKI